MCKAPLARFEVQDVRVLDQRHDLRDQFDVVICCENIEHILNDRKLMVDMSGCLKANGILLLTTPNLNYVPITKGDLGPFSKVEDGGHVRKGYSSQDLNDLCVSAGLNVARIGFCSGFMSQKITALLRIAGRIHPLIGWGLVLPLRVLPLIFDPWIARMTNWPGFSITLVATKGVD